MLSLLFGLAFWLVVVWAACGAVILLGVLWFCLEEWLDKHQRLLAIEADGRWNRLVGYRPAAPFDQDDPLEQLGALPCAPDPRWLS